MSENNLMTPSMLAKELNAGSATVRFWLNRFSRYLPYTWADGEKLYHADTLKTLLFISEKIDSGMVATEVEKALEAEILNKTGSSVNPALNSFIPSIQSAIQNAADSSSQTQQLQPINESIKLISALFDKFYSQQERIAEAQERKAAAEEKRAEAELQKANAMNNLADAIKNISSDFLSSLADNSIFSDLNNRPPVTNQEPTEQEPESTTETEQADQIELEDEIEQTDEELDNEDIDDLSALIEDETTDEKHKNGTIDDLYSLVEDDTDNYDLDEADDEELDDLSALIQDEIADKEREDEKIDDLYSLVEDDIYDIDDDGSDKADEVNESYEPDDEDLDDLSALIQDDQPHELKPEILDSDVDDLMALIDDDINQQSGGDNIFDSGSSNDNDLMDDLSSLIDDEPAELNPNILDNDADNILNDINDDLSALIQEEENITMPPKIERPKASLEENFEQYKSEVINIIIKLRKEGLSVDETTELLNKEQIKPLSGKERWTTKMIAKIYKFIEAAQK
ncbi:MAG: hypothetical protein AB7U45_15070 [Desulfamplus sp.]